MNTITPANTFDYSALDRAAIGDATRDKYKRAIQRLLDKGINPFDGDDLADYAASLSLSAKGHLKSALAIMTREYRRMLKANSTPENSKAIQADLWRLEAMDDAIQVHALKGKKTHTWLSGQQVEQITALPDRFTVRGTRDYIVLAVLLGAGVRRDELVNLTFDAIRQQPTKAGLRDVLSVTGKGGRRRTIPISAKLAHHLRQWHAVVGDGYIARSINKAGTINGSLSAIGIHNIVRHYGALIGIPNLACHDTRRTFAMLGLNAGVPITQISVLLGHESIETTQDYLDLEIDLDITISDHIPLSGD